MTGRRFSPRPPCRAGAKLRAHSEREGLQEHGARHGDSGLVEDDPITVSEALEREANRADAADAADS